MRVWGGGGQVVKVNRQMWRQVLKGLETATLSGKIASMEPGPEL